MHRYSMLFDSVREKKKINMIKKKRTKNDRNKSDMPNMCFFLLLLFIKKKKKLSLLTNSLRGLLHKVKQ